MKHLLLPYLFPHKMYLNNSHKYHVQFILHLSFVLYHIMAKEEDHRWIFSLYSGCSEDSDFSCTA